MKSPIALNVDPVFSRRAFASQWDVMSFLTTSPFFITNRTRSSSVMSAIGSPVTATRSANFPASTAPMRSCQPNISAALHDRANHIERPYPGVVQRREHRRARLAASLSRNEPTHVGSGGKFHSGFQHALNQVVVSLPAFFVGISQLRSKSWRDDNGRLKGFGNATAIKSRREVKEDSLIAHCLELLI